ncbi:hypothetical protein DITRI_Ditri12bG0047400 [Diplodiscus trichospermus]
MYRRFSLKKDHGLPDWVGWGGNHEIQKNECRVADHGNLEEDEKEKMKLNSVQQLLKPNRNTSSDINTELILDSPQNHYLITTPMKRRQDNLLDRFLSSSTTFFGYSLWFLFIFTPLKRIAPQKGSSVIVVFIAKAPASHPFSLHPFAIHT